MGVGVESRVRRLEWEILKKKQRNDFLTWLGFDSEKSKKNCTLTKKTLKYPKFEDGTFFLLDELMNLNILKEINDLRPNPNPKTSILAMFMSQTNLNKYFFKKYKLSAF